jgi:N-acyl-D-aspartate/D-glutamate deacylase
MVGWVDAHTHYDAQVTWDDALEGSASNGVTATSVPATVWGMHDRGTLTAGKRADINVINFENLASRRPELRPDLRAAGSRFLQPANGYLATIVAGSTVRRNDQDTGARPGRLTRRLAPTGAQGSDAAPARN